MAQEQAATTQGKAAETTGPQIAKPPEETTGAIERAPRTALTTPERTSPFAIMRQLMDDMDRFFSGFSLGMPSLFGLTPRAFELARRGFWAPAIETFERDGRLVLRTELPGLRREDVNVEIAGRRAGSVWRAKARGGGGTALSANVRETAARPKFSVEGEPSSSRWRCFFATREMARSLSLKLRSAAF